MDVSINGEPVGRIVVGLYGASAPKGSRRFAGLVSGAPGTSYRRKEFTKIMPGFVQHGGIRSYGPEAAEELLAEWEAGAPAGCGGAVRTAAGSVGIVVRDPNKPPPKIKLVARKGRLEVDEEETGPPQPNGTEFVIATKDAPELDASTLVVGKVIDGMDVVRRIAGVKTVQENTSSPYFRVAKLIGDKRAVVAERGFNRPYSKIVVTNCGLIN